MFYLPEACLECRTGLPRTVNRLLREKRLQTSQANALKGGRCYCWWWWWNLFQHGVSSSTMFFTRAMCLPKFITSLKISHKINFLQNYVKTTETILQFISLNAAEIIRVLKELRVGCVLAFNGKLFQRTETPYWELRLPRSHLHFQQLQQFAGE